MLKHYTSYKLSSRPNTEAHLTHPLNTPLTNLRYVGGRRALFLDEISTGLDSATLFNIVSMLGRITRWEVWGLCTV